MEKDFINLIKETKKVSGLQEIKNEKRILEYIRAYGYDFDKFQ